MTTSLPKGDLKEGLTSSRPRLSLVPSRATVYAVRALEYGADKYRRGNYHGAGPEGVSDIERFLGYIDATERHLGDLKQAINVAMGRGEDVIAACRVVDDKPGENFPPSGLPHIAHALASLVIMIEVGIDLGLLEADPGQPWKAQAKSAERLRAAVERQALRMEIGMVCELCGENPRMRDGRVCKPCVDAREHHNETASGQGTCEPARPLGCHCMPGKVCQQCTERARKTLGIEDDGYTTVHPKL